MTTHHASPAEGEPPEFSAQQVESALRGQLPLNGDPDVAKVADLINALRSPAERNELRGYNEAMNAFGATLRRPSTPSKRIAMISSAVGIKALATSAGAAVALGAVATVVLTSGAFGPSRQVLVQPASTTSAASAATTPGPQASKGAAKDDEDKSGTAVGPDARGPAAFGLCNAWSKNPDKAKADQSVAHRNLAKAAGGEAKIAAYCATVPHPGATKGPKPGAPNSKSNTAKPAKPTKPVHPSPSSTAKAGNVPSPGVTTAPGLTKPTGTPSATATALPTTSP